MNIKFFLSKMRSESIDYRFFCCWLPKNTIYIENISNKWQVFNKNDDNFFCVGSNFWVIFFCRWNSSEIERFWNEMVFANFGGWFKNSNKKNALRNLIFFLFNNKIKREIAFAYLKIKYKFNFLRYVIIIIINKY